MGLYRLKLRDKKKGLVMRYKTTMLDLTAKVRFTSKDCWLWTGQTTGRGNYGQVSFDSKKVRVHRLVMHFRRGFDLKSRDWIKHKCNRHLCINPSHLFIFKRPQK